MRPETLTPGFAQLAINGNRLAALQPVRCIRVGTLTTIAAGPQDAGIETAVSSSPGLQVEYLTIRKVDGFTGNYNRELNTEARVTMTGATYTITGTASGYGPKSDLRTTAPFEMKAAC